MQVLRELFEELRQAARWLRSRHAWKLLLAVLVPAGLVLFIGYLSVARGRLAVGLLCHFSEDGTIVTLFYLSAGLALSGMVLMGEVVNLVDAQRRNRPARNLRPLAVSGSLALAFAAAIVYVMLRC